MFILVSTCANDGDGYGGYAIGWQIAGIFVPACGLVAFIVCLFFNVYEETYEKNEFDEDYFIRTSDPDYDLKAEKMKEVEMEGVPKTVDGDGTVGKTVD